MQFGDRLRKLRENKTPKCTQTTVAKAVGMSQKKISRIECNTFEPSLRDIILLCNYYQVSADYLLGLPDDLPYPEG